MTCKGCKGQPGAGWGIRWTLADSAGGSERSLEVPDKYYALRSVLIAALLPAIAAGLTSSEGPGMTVKKHQSLQ